MQRLSVGVAGDLVFALRLFRRSGSIQLVAIVVLALGISFAALGREMSNAPFGQGVGQAEAVGVLGFGPGAGRPAPNHLLSAIARPTRSFAHVTAVDATRATLEVEGQKTTVTVARVSSGFFQLAGVQPATGRAFSPGEHESGAPVVVLSDVLWRQVFHSDRNALGKSITLAGAPLTVVGIMPEGFVFPAAQAWTPTSLAALESAAANRSIPAYVRLDPASTWAAAHTELKAIGTRLPAEDRQESDAGELEVMPLQQLMADRAPQMFLLFQVPTLLLLFVTALSVASLVFSRTIAREREIAIRVAVGASRTRLARQFLAEGLVLAAPAGVLASFLLVLEIFALQSLAPPTQQWLAGAVRFSSHTLVAVVATTILLTLVLACAPLFFTVRVAVAPGIARTFMRPLYGFRRLTIRDLLLVLQVGAAFPILAFALVFVVAYTSMFQPRFGYEVDKLIVTRLSVEPPNAREHTFSQTLALYDVLAGKLRSQPGVLAVSFAHVLPEPMAGNAGPLTRVSVGAGPVRTRKLLVGPNLISALGGAILRGRDIGDQDVQSGLPVVVVSQSLATTLWQNDDPLGRSLRARLESGTERSFVVVGVAPDLNYLTVDPRGRRMAYFPFSDAASGSGDVQVLARTSTDATALLDEVRAALRSPIGPAVVGTPETYDAARRESREMASAMGFYLAIMWGATALTFLITVVGITAVTAETVMVNKKSLAIRAALGATPGALVTQVFQHAVTKISLGVLMGLPFGLVVALRDSNGPQLGPLLLNPIWLPAMAVSVAAWLLACYLPARSAGAADLPQVMKEE